MSDDNVSGALATAEREARIALTSAIESHQFDRAKSLVEVIAAIATARKALAGEAIERAADGQSDAAPAAVPSTSADDQPPAPTSRSRTRSSQYPFFERDGDRLIKVGWSSKARSTYEHRVSEALVRDVCKAFGSRPKSRKPLRIESVLPLHDSAGTEIPTYQVYLVLKWLQHLGVAERRGKDGYRISASALGDEAVSQLLASTRERSSG